LVKDIFKGDWKRKGGLSEINRVASGTRIEKEESRKITQLKRERGRNRFVVGVGGGGGVGGGVGGGGRKDHEGEETCDNGGGLWSGSRLQTSLKDIAKTSPKVQQESPQHNTGPYKKKTGGMIWQGGDFVGGDGLWGFSFRRWKKGTGTKN